MKGYSTYLAGTGYALIFGFSFLVTKTALAALDPFELLALRFTLAALAMTVLVALGIIKVNFGADLRRYLAAACLFQPLFYFTCETYGIRESASSTAGIVLGALPAAVAVLGALTLKERLSLRQAAALGLSIVGVAVIVLWGGVTDGRTGTLRGVLFLFGAVASATFFNVLSRRASSVFSPATTTFAMMWSGALGFGAIALVRGIQGGRLVGAQGLFVRAAPAWFGILYLGLLSSVLAFFFVNFTLSRLKASQSVVFANLATVVSVAAGVLIRGENFGIAQLVGSVMIVLGVWGTNAAGRADERARRGSRKLAADAERERAAAIESGG